MTGNHTAIEQYRIEKRRRRQPQQIVCGTCGQPLQSGEYAMTCDGPKHFRCTADPTDPRCSECGAPVHYNPDWPHICEQ